MGAPALPGASSSPSSRRKRAQATRTTLELDDYEVVRKVGRGKYSEVFVAAYQNVGILCWFVHDQYLARLVLCSNIWCC
ncbi:hypothetical protein RIF29_25886 [Crotalaria pallida]|uniref:Uncharacterized protein n=1 Tax=Crotalaria pallida TaxID=3830 RepID=A0AAN9EM46_CROPI